MARSRDRVSAQTGVQPARSSPRDHSGRTAGGTARGAPGVLLRADSPGCLGAGRQPRHHRSRRAPGAWHRRLPWLWIALRGDLRQRGQCALRLCRRPRPELTVMPDIHIRALKASPDILRALSDILVETVAGGGSVSFMHPLAPEAALAFWQGSLAAAGRGERVVLGAFDGDELIATVTLLLELPPNQPHRAEIAKMMTRVSHRGRGAATALMRAAEHLAAERGRSLLVLDTAVEDGASRLYEARWASI